MGMPTTGPGHRPRGTTSPEKGAGLPGWGDGLETLQATGHQASLSWQLTDPSTQTSTRGTTRAGTRYCHESNITAKVQPETAQPSTRQTVRCVQQRKKSTESAGKET